MTDAEFLRSLAVHFEMVRWSKHAVRLEEIALDHDRMERELNRITQEAREAHAALTELKP